MIIKQTVAPTTEPISLTEAKSHMRVDISDDDDYITSLITAAREYIEFATRRALITQTWRYSLEKWPTGDEFEIPKPPLQSITTFQYTDSDGTTSDVDSDLYEVDTDSEPARIKLAYGQSWPSETLKATNPIQVTFVAGYGDDAEDVPGYLRHAIKFLVEHWYENREPVAAVTLMPVPLAVDSLIWLNRVY
jgi:uncharacterized phiE125 gp8 family phage protein